MEDLWVCYPCKLLFLSLRPAGLENCLYSSIQGVKSLRLSFKKYIYIYFIPIFSLSFSHSVSMSPFPHFSNCSAATGKWTSAQGILSSFPRLVCSPDKISLPVPGSWPLLCHKGCLSVIVGHWFGEEVTLFPSPPPPVHFLSIYYKLKRDFCSLPIVTNCQLMSVTLQSIMKPYNY